MDENVTVINSMKNTAGDRYHYCPQTSQRTTSDECQGCEYLIRFEDLLGYRIHCKAGTDTGLVQIDPPRAEDSIPESMGASTLDAVEQGWTVIEPKLDGARILLHVSEHGNRMTTRRKDRFGNYKERSDNLPHLRDLDLGSAGTIIDGEVIAPAVAEGHAGSLGSTMSVIGSDPDKAIEIQEREGYLVYWAFDMPFCQGRDIRHEPFSYRRDLLEAWYDSLKSYEAHERIKLMPSEDMKGWRRVGSPPRRYAEAAVAGFLAEGYEGAILKNPGSPYGGLRAWLKVKERYTVDVQVTGFLYGSKGGKYEKQVGSLAVSILQHSGDLAEVCTVIPGDDALRLELTEKLVGRTQQEIIDLGIVIEVEFQNWTKNRRLRHPRIVRYRPDRSSPNVIDLGGVDRK